MKNLATLIMLICILFISTLSNAQNTFPSTGSAGIGTTTPAASALLEMKSTAKGLLIPRMTAAQKNAITSPADGLMIYQTDSTSGFYYYHAAWIAVQYKGANTTLSNLAGTSINTTLLPKTDSAYSIGKSTLKWRDINMYNLRFADGTVQTSAAKSYTAGTGISISGTTISSTLNSSQWSSVGNDIYYYSGNVVIGSHAPLGKFNVEGGDIVVEGLNVGTGHGNFSSNTVLGNSALYNTTADYNTAVGATVLYSNTSGSYNTGIGEGSLFSNTTGVNNTASGSNALSSNTTGEENTGDGTFALASNSTGIWNVASGYNALGENTIGNFNTAVGVTALANSISGDNNSAFGVQSLNSNTTGASNTAIGVSSLILNTTGYSNVAVGINALKNNTTQSNSVAIGDSALYNFNGTSYALNTAVGSKALYSATSGYSNTATGAQSLYSNTTGFANTATGYASLNSNSGGNYNVATGSRALTSNTSGSCISANGAYSLYYNTTGSFNTANGYESLISNITGTDNTAMGSSADVSSGALSNAAAIGYAANVDASNKVRVGNTSVTSIGGQVGWTSFSDGRYKKNIKEDVKGLAFINSLRPITYTLDLKGLNDHYDALMNKKPDSLKQKLRADMKESETAGSNIIYNGFIAQDVETAAKKLNYNFSGIDKPATKDGLYGLRYSDFVVPLVKAVQELSKQNDSLKNSGGIQQKINTDLQKQIDDLKAIVLSGNQSSSNVAETNKQIVELSSNAALSQNIPNPFSNSTVINYNLPVNNGNAYMNFYSVNGTLLKSVKLAGNGKGTIALKANELASGTYRYTLLVDGKNIDSKQMISSK